MLKALLSLLVLCTGLVAQPLTNCGQQKTVQLQSQVVVNVLPLSGNDRWYVCAVYVSSTPSATLDNGLHTYTYTIYYGFNGSQCIGAGNLGGRFPMFSFSGYPGVPITYTSQINNYLPVGAALCVGVNNYIDNGSVQVFYGSPNTPLPSTPPPPPPPSMPTPGNQIFLSGTVRYPDGTLFNGSVILTLTRSTITLSGTCGPVQVLVFRPITLRIVNGVMQSVNLYPTLCMQPPQKYNAQFFDNRGNLLFRAAWAVESNNGIIDVSQLN